MDRVKVLKAGVAPGVAAGVAGLAFLEGLRDRRQPMPPFAVETDVWLTGVESGRVAFAAKPSSRFCYLLGTVHGGWIATLLDPAMGYAVRSLETGGPGYTRIDMTVGFMRPVFEKTGEPRREGKVVHAGRRAATAGRVWDAAGARIAQGLETCRVSAVPGMPS